MKSFEVITEEYINEKIKVYDELIKRTKEIITRCRSEKNITKKTKELEDLIKEKEIRIKRLNDRLEAMNKAKTYEGKAEFILPMGGYGTATRLRKYDTIEEVITDAQWITLHKIMYIAPIGTQAKYQKAMEEAKKILNELHN